MFWIKVLSVALCSSLLHVHSLPTSVLVDSKSSALKASPGEKEFPPLNIQHANWADDDSYRWLP